MLTSITPRQAKRLRTKGETSLFRVGISWFPSTPAFAKHRATHAQTTARKARHSQRGVPALAHAQTAQAFHRLRACVPRRAARFAAGELFLAGGTQARRRWKA